jgi:glycosyltransferase involved in cell wall biosynthesis
MPRPLVSVVVPVYNGERFLAQALESALAQEYEPFEVIVVDDGSTDGSAAVAQAYPVRYLNRRNGGVAAARNEGVTAATGEFLAFLDQDDLWLQGKLERQVSYLLEHPEVGFVHTSIEVLFEPGTPRPRWLKPDAPLNPFLPSTLMMRRETFELVGPFDPRFSMTSDADWLARARQAGVRRAVLDEPLVRYRVHDANGMHQQGLLKTEMFRVLKASALRQRATAETDGA